MLVKDPIYYQVNHLLREIIRTGEYHKGDKFLTERQICERFDISRATANKALSNLVSEGVLEFRKGVGTFLSSDLLDYDLRALVSFTEKARQAGKHPSTQLLRFETQPANERAEILQHTPETPLYYMERLRLADSIPVILEARYLVPHFCPNLTAELLTGSFYELLTHHYHLEVMGAEEVIRAVILSDEEAQQLAVISGSAALCVESVGYLKGGIPLWQERTLYRGDSYEFRNHLGPIKGAHPAMGTLCLEVKR